jgi:hypothetical protein
MDELEDLQLRIHLPIELAEWAVLPGPVAVPGLSMDIRGLCRDGGA